MRGFSYTKRAHKVLKWDFHYDAIYQSVRKLHHSIFSHFLKYCWILKTVNDNNNCSLRNDNYNKITSEDIAPIMLSYTLV